MARNSERAMLLLNRWQEMKMAVTKGVRRRRPRSAEEINSVKDAEFWRNNIIREISVKIAEIQNAALGEARLRELNDEINRLIKDKQKWEDQIKALGGPDYKATAGGLFESSALTARDGYKYFGAAKELSSVRELLEAQSGSGYAKPPARLNRADLAKRIQPSYYGWYDETENPEMLRMEKELEEKLAAEMAAA
eukprot:Gregarina_sp_Poly_1__2518@NODE_1681_length_3545_cov_85_334675_g1104_i0_p4_GENE_NODE_1681_length_3545_cov_85_334675_g1104_i0NODE_1681_length_3545_cov_85_334675_g1104_i0_p4_ORF_typecomplete_len194_score39_90Isy1/PF06246_12/2e59DivIC/PF04977_15/0_049DivIC/PF04977_15/7e03Mit_ribos_Mrp51/PF11709_8/0_076DUF1492/PF07374_11/0_3DUF1492/PF07374_11/2_2e03WGG/PF10273_9/0_53WGG/PF10273_9/2_6e03ZapB/PF06005_12/0_14ZapB/PF06005_12/1_4e03_NODE_1681_length_3545_cov_85_334675_g1104_i05531134